MEAMIAAKRTLDSLQQPSCPLICCATLFHHYYPLLYCVLKAYHEARPRKAINGTLRASQCTRPMYCEPKADGRLDALTSSRGRVSKVEYLSLCYGTVQTANTKPPVDSEVDKLR